VIYHDYGTADGISDRLSRIWRIRETSDSSTILSEYAYNGTNRLATTYHSPPDVKLDLYAGSTSGTYDGLDRFGRTIDQWWRNLGAGTDTDQTKYTYDYAENRLTRDVVTSSNNTRNQAYAYDGLHRLTLFDEGTLAGTSISTPTREEDWTLDQLGNWTNRIDAADQIDCLEQQR